MKPREQKHKCCVCGRKKSKVWLPLKPKCEACSESCATWHESNAPAVCPFHKYREPTDV